MYSSVYSIQQKKLYIKSYKPQSRKLGVQYHLHLQESVPASLPILV